MNKPDNFDALKAAASATFVMFTTTAAAMLFYAVVVVAHRLWFHPLAKYPGPILAKISNTYSGYHAWRGSLHIDMLRCHNKYGSFVRYAPNRLLVNTASGLKDIYDLSANVQKSSAYLAMKHRAPNVLTAVDKKTHGRRRRLISQGLSDSSTRGFEDTIKQHVEKLCNQISPGHSDASTQWSRSHDLSRWSSYLTFDIMADIVFGQQYNLLGDDENRYVVDSIEGSNIRTGVLIQAPEASIWRLDRHLFPKSIQCRNKFIEFISRLVLDRMTTSPLKRNDIISHLLTAKDKETNEGFTKNEVMAESTTLVVAGTDTSSTAISATFFYLTHYPGFYQRAAAEVRSAFATSKDVKIGSRLNACIFTRACIEESLRMSPPAGSALWRQVLDGGQIVDGHVIPSGCDIGVCIYAIHHNDAYFTDPFDFKPDRWLPNDEVAMEKARLGRSAYNPFSIGPRSCIGKGFAMAELMLTVVTMLIKFDIRRSSGREGCIGQGSVEAGDGRHRLDEFQLYDHVTAYKKGPALQFRSRGPASLPA